MKLKSILILILTSSLLFFTSTFVKAEEEIILNTTSEPQTIKEKKYVVRETFQKTLKADREARKTKIEEMKADFKTKRDDFKEKIKIIKDEKKKQLTEKIDNRMLTVNKNQTDRMKKALEKLAEHIQKLEERGIDVTTAKEAVSIASAAVEQQAAKDYVFTIADEKNLGQSVKASYDLLSQDLKNVQALLVKAKEAVVSAYEIAGKLKKITPTPTVTTP